MQEKKTACTGVHITYNGYTYSTGIKRFSFEILNINRKTIYLSKRRKFCKISSSNDYLKKCH